MQFACRADFVEPSLHREAVERIEPEAGEELDARVELPPPQTCSSFCFRGVQRECDAASGSRWPTNGSLRKASCAERLKSGAGPVIEKRFRHDASGGVAGTEKEDAIAARRLDHEQQSGPQQPRTSGFFARIVALAKRPSSSPASRSTSRPASLRNARASSSL